MLTVREIQFRTQEFFASRGVPNPKLDADVLIAHSLGVKRLDLYLDLDRPLTEAQLDSLRPLVRRRGKREPLQYIIGWIDFAGIKLKVDSRALIPRQETEELVELLLSRIEGTPGIILDLGTGTGALALALATNYPEAQVVAVDASRDALDLARENAAQLVLIDRIRFIEGSWYDPIPRELKFDLIVSNPPYLTESEMETAEPEVADFEPGAALVSGATGMDDLKIIIENVSDFLNPGGLLALETGIAHQDELDRLSNESGLQGEAINDLSGRHRFYLARKV